MGAKNDITAYLKSYRYADTYGEEEDGWALLAARQLYEATGDEEYFSLIQKYYDGFLSENGEIRGSSTADFTADTVNGSRCLFFLYDKTGEEKYRLAIENIMSGLRGYERCECGNFVCCKDRPKEVTVDALYGFMPFYMEYETKYDKKEKYGDIIRQFENAQKLLYDEEKGLCCRAYVEEGKTRRMEENGCAFAASARYLAALADTMDCMSVEIYEQYRKLQDMFKQVLKGVLNCRAQGNGEGDNVLIGYCILKACRMGILLKEKYVDTGMEIVKKMTETESAETTATSVMAYAQYLLTESEAEA